MRDRPLIPAAITGNSRLLATYTATGELQSLWWPHIDYGQHLHQMFVGVRAGPGPTAWTQGSKWAYAQRYEGDTPILVTRGAQGENGLAVAAVDFAVPGTDMLLRRITVTNEGSEPRPVELMLYAHVRLDESHQYNTVLYEPDLPALLFYRRHTWMAVVADRAPTGWQCGRPGRPSDAWPMACSGALSGREIDCGDVNGALLFDLGTLASGGEVEVTLCIAMGHTRAAVTDQVRQFRQQPAGAWQEQVAQWWADWLERGRQPETGSPQFDRLYRRSQITLKLMSDERGGGLIAGPELDPEYQLSGGYAYCWGRDAAYMTTALDEAGHHEITRDFFLKWAMKAQEESGAWLHRHYVDGTLAPSWGLLQIDEGASILYGAWRHYELTGDLQFARAFWPAAARGADFLVAYRDQETGLPGHSIDLWEKRNGLHAYSSAAVYAGLEGAARLAEAVGADGSRYRDTAALIRAVMEQRLWSGGEGRFRRTISLRGTGPAEQGRQDLAVADIPDISLLGLFFPFGIFAADDPRIQATAALLEGALAVPETGAVYRYPGDQYIGGHPWLICSLWLAIYKQAVGEQDRARELVQWAADRATPLGLLPEQVDLQTGQPTWVTPLAWSHAMLLLALHRLAPQEGVSARAFN